MKVVLIALAVLFAPCLMGVGAARAEVTDRSPAGFEVTYKVAIAAPPAKVYAALMNPGAWWSKDHTFSHDPRNLSIDLAAGCFCEKLPSGTVRHLTVVFADGATHLRMSGAMGPLQSTGATGHLGFALKPDGANTELTLTYDVGGYAKGGLADTWAAPVNGMLGETVGRLKRYVETGKPE